MGIRAGSRGCGKMSGERQRKSERISRFPAEHGDPRGTGSRDPKIMA